jgi:hypothetical protein
MSTADDFEALTVDLVKNPLRIFEIDLILVVDNEAFVFNMLGILVCNKSIISS